ncbi:MAG: hypothetical protein AB7P17_15450 [Nitrospirales bacterium]
MSSRRAEGIRTTSGLVLEINLIAWHIQSHIDMNAGVSKTGKHQPFLQLIMTMGIFYMIAACAALPTVRQQDLDAWVGIPVEALNTHPSFKNERMFRTRTHGGTEIRNYAYGYNFEECFGKAGAGKIGDFVEEDTFIRCSSGRIVCNNLFYIRNGKVLEYAPIGLCTTDTKVQPETHYLKPNSP